MSRSHARSRISATIRWPGFVKTTIIFISYIICSTIIIIVMIENDYKCSSTSRLPGSILRGDWSLCFRPTRTPLTMIGSLQHLITGDLKCSKLCGIWKYCETQTSPMILLFLVNIKLQLNIFLIDEIIRRSCCCNLTYSLQGFLVSYNPGRSRNWCRKIHL